MERAQKDVTATNCRYVFNNARPKNLHLMAEGALDVYFGDYPEDDLTAMNPDVIMDGTSPVRFEEGMGISVLVLTVSSADVAFSAMKW